MKRLKQITMGVVAMCLVVMPFTAQSTAVNAAQAPSVAYSAHVQNIGWQNYVKDGALAGTSGKALRVESFRMKLENSPVAGDVSYATHIQNIGWQAPRTSNQISGTTGQSLRMEAMRIRLTGEIAKQYDVYYRTHVQNFGWLGWSKNGEDAGSEGYGYRMEAIEIKLVKKGDKGPQVGDGFVSKHTTPSVTYSAHVQNIGWQPYVADGALAGTSGKGLRVESFRMKLENSPIKGDIQYATHIQNIGWQAPRTNNQISGTTGQSLRMEAMRINLTGEIANHYDVYYRTHVQNIGWMNWVKNGEDAGTSGRGFRMEAIEIKLVKKAQVTKETEAMKAAKATIEGLLKGDRAQHDAYYGAGLYDAKVKVALASILDALGASSTNITAEDIKELYTLGQVMLSKVRIDYEERSATEIMLHIHQMRLATETIQGWILTKAASGELSESDVKDPKKLMKLILEGIKKDEITLTETKVIDEVAVFKRVNGKLELDPTGITKITQAMIDSNVA